MKNKVKYIGTYTDNHGTTNIVIENNFEKLFMEIDGVSFSGEEFSDFAIEPNINYSEQDLERFSFLHTPIYDSDAFAKTLCNCTFQLKIPQIIIEESTHTEHTIHLDLTYKLGNVRLGPRGGIEEENLTISFAIQGNKFTASGGFFEEVLDKIQKQFDQKFRFKNCYGCQFGDYSVFGQSSFGTMLCFIGEKDKYLTAKNKEEYISIAENQPFVREIFCCEKYEPRRKGVGYRD